MDTAKPKERKFLEDIKNGVTVDKLRHSLFVGGNWKERDEDGRTALHLAAKMGRLDVVKFLIFQLLADVNIKDNEGVTPLEYALSSPDPEKCFDVLYYLVVLGANKIDETKIQNFENLARLYEGLEDGKLKTILKRAGVSCSKSPDRTTPSTNVDAVKHNEMNRPIKRRSQRIKDNSDPKIQRLGRHRDCKKALFV